MWPPAFQSVEADGRCPRTPSLWPVIVFVWVPLGDTAVKWRFAFIGWERFSFWLAPGRGGV